MASFNKVFLMGNLTKDPELRYTPAGMPVANLRLAVNRKYRTKTNELKEEVCFITCVVWSKQAETSNQYLRKGSPVFIEGRLQSRSWDDQNGQKRSVIEVLAERVQFLSQGQGGQSRQGQEPPPEDSPAADSSTTESAWLDENQEGPQ